MLSIFVHGDLRAVEDRRLIHVIPGEEVKGGAFIGRGLELGGPEEAHFGVEEIQPAGGTYRVKRYLSLSAPELQ